MFGQQPGQTGADEYGVYGGAAGGYPGGAMAAGAAMAPGDETSTSPGPTYLPTVPPTNLGGPALMSGLPFTSQELLYYQQLYSRHREQGICAGYQCGERSWEEWPSATASQQHLVDR